MNVRGRDKHARFPGREPFCGGPTYVAPSIVLVHGAWHSPWSWTRVIEGLDRRGLASTTVDLPSCRPELGPSADMHTDAAEIRSELDRHTDVVLVAHSYGGIPATEAAAGHPAVRHLVYLAAYNADEGETLMGYTTRDVEPQVLNPPADLEIDTTGMMVVRPDRAATIFYNDLEPVDADEAVGHLRPMSAAVLDQSPVAIAWKQVPSTYIRTRRDNATPPVVQDRLSARASRVHELDSGHSPFLSRPDEVAELIAHVAVEAATR